MWYSDAIPFAQLENEVVKFIFLCLLQLVFTAPSREDTSRNKINFESQTCSTCEPKENAVRCQQRASNQESRVQQRAAMESNANGLAEMTDDEIFPLHYSLLKNGETESSN
ncbi:hypothetical protein TNCV_4936781 [Trichonephila clavipes]|nr:hypothetical protein TNCV_4936781 [Trichonephila clavipes]